MDSVECQILWPQSRARPRVGGLAAMAEEESARGGRRGADPAPPRGEGGMKGEREKEKGGSWPGGGRVRSCHWSKGRRLRQSLPSTLRPTHSHIAARPPTDS